MTGTLRVAVVGLGARPETFLARMLRGLRDEDVVATVVGPADPGLDGVEWAPARRPGRVRIDDARLAFDVVRRQPQRRSVARSWALDAGVAAVDPDVVYLPWTATAVEQPHVFDLGLPVVVSCRGAHVNVAPWNPERDNLRAGLPGAFAKATLVHGVSEAIIGEAVVHGLDPSKARVIRPAVDPTAVVERSDRAEGGRLRIVSVGSVIWRKGHRYAVEAMRELLDRGVNAELRIIGTPTEDEPIRHAIWDLDLSDRVTIVGALPPDAVLAELSEADVGLCTSLSEGIANGTLEAMATGLPVVVTAVGGMTEAVTDGVDGFVAPVRDPAAVADALQRLGRDPALRARLGRAAQATIRERFDLGDHVRTFAALFREAAR